MSENDNCSALTNRITNDNLAKLMCIGPEPTAVDFNNILDIFKAKNCRLVILLDLLL